MEHKGELMFPKNKTFRSEKYKEYIRGLECVGCEYSMMRSGYPAEAAHTETGGTGIKGSDLSCIPLCTKHHMEEHQTGRKTFAKKYNLDYNEILVECLQGYIEEVEGGED